VTSPPSLAPPGLPSPDVLVALVREKGSSVLDAYAPAIDETVDVAAAAAWLGKKPASISRERSRRRPDGTLRLPAFDYPAGRSGSWRKRTLIEHLAAMPGRGSAGRGRPAARSAAAQAEDE
jgi:hypothetical protein